MGRVRVKICGITSPRDLHIAVEAGADAVGFIVDVPQSPRNLSRTKAKKLMRTVPIFVETVAVTVPRDLNHLEEIHKELSPFSKVIQVHGLTHLHKEVRKGLPGTRLIGAIQAKSDLAIDVASEVADTFDAVLLDSYHPGRHGGTGRTHNWELSKRIRDIIHPRPLVLAGGLKPGNVKEAIYTVKPYAVDVSSGVESSPGIKDRKRVSEFVKNAKGIET